MNNVNKSSKYSKAIYKPSACFSQRFLVDSAKDGGEGHFYSSRLACGQIVAGVSADKTLELVCLESIDNIMSSL